LPASANSQRAAFQLWPNSLERGARAEYIDKILLDAQPSEIPVEQEIKLEQIAK
jgi:hypothetical protein